MMKCPLASTPGDGSRSTWGDPKTALPPLLGETLAYPPLAAQIREDFNSYAPRIGGMGSPLGIRGRGE